MTSIIVSRHEENVNYGSYQLDEANHEHEKIHKNEHDKWCSTRLFQKELTPSDVGKLNRLVIPKKFALKYFSYIFEHQGQWKEILVFYDKGMKSWNFRYCYWRSSQSFVFTRGWNRFVKENKLKEKDIVTFYRCTLLHHANNNKATHDEFFFIDVTRQNMSDVFMCEGYGFNLRPHMIQTEGKNLVYDNKNSSKTISTINVQEKGVRLFGVQIL
ncbi:AP2/ERF and B3 domain-containing transcription factor At1g50680 [Linum perenne]